MNAQEMLNQAILELGNLKNGDAFIVRDLFKGYLWDSQSRAERLTLGTLFMNYAKQNGDKIRMAGKNSSGQQMYELLDAEEFKLHTLKNCFEKTGVIKLSVIDKKLIHVSIGTSGMDLCEMSIRTQEDVEKLSSVLKQFLDG